MKHGVDVYRINPDQAEDEKAPSMGAKSLCIPFDQARFGEFEADQKCIACGEKAKRWTMFGRSESRMQTFGDGADDYVQVTRRVEDGLRLLDIEMQDVDRLRAYDEGRAQRRRADHFDYN